MEAIVLTGFDIWAIVKILFLFAIAIYVVFAIVVVRQVGLMTKTLEVGFEIPIKFIAWLHLLFALGTFVLALLIL
ncbi:MAG: DUF5657 family protein [Patescibacteria group bacterium]